MIVRDVKHFCLISRIKRFYAYGIYMYKQAYFRKFIMFM